MLFPGAVAGVAQESREYRCTPDIKYECTRDRCEKITSDFQQAESFAYDVETSQLSACLWTNCYAARATVLKDIASGTITAIGRLMPSAHPGNEPIIVSLTIGTAERRHNGDATAKKTADFTAIWGYGGKGLTFDMGRCSVQELK